jgi:hypothetical protein
MGDALTEEELRKRSAPMVIVAGHITVDPERDIADVRPLFGKGRA